MVHLIKLCVGCDSIKDLIDWIAHKRKEFRAGHAPRRGPKYERFHTTRMMPKRADELADGGSLYWVIRGEIACRERILGVRQVATEDGTRCRIVLDGKPVAVEPRPYRAFQGWRYLAPKDAPRDLGQSAPGADQMPESMRRDLRDLGLL